MVKLINSERGSGCQEPEGGRCGGLLITGHKIPVKRDEYSVKIAVTTLTTRQQRFIHLKICRKGRSRVK